MGTGPDHGIYDVYVGGSLWQSFDSYAASAGQRDIVITLGVDNRKLQGDGPHLVEIRNRAEKNKTSTGYKVRFKQLLVVDRTWTLQTIRYSYDKLARLLEARYAPGANAAAVDGDLLRRYLFTHDRAGNRLSQSVALNGGAPTVTNYTYNAANQLTSGSATYDNNGNLTSDGVNSYTWDRANRLVEWDNGVAADLTAYAYDGLGNRIAQSLGTTSPTITKYLLDLQPGLAVVLAETTGANVIRYVHAPRGIHAHKDASGAWEWMVQDGLGSVRGVVDNSVGVLWSGSPAPYGEYFDETGTRQTNYGFTGEYTDPTTELVHLRARDYNPALGVLTALDPFEGMASRPMSLNGYSWVEGNVPNTVDPSGKCSTLLATYNPCHVQIQQPIQMPWSCVANSPNQALYSQVNGPFGIPIGSPSTDLWTCDGQNCQEWLDEAHCILNEGSPGYAPTAITKEIAEGLLFNSRQRLTWGTRISFTGSDPGTAYAILRTLIVMPSAALSGVYAQGHPTPGFKNDIAILSHEYYHTAQYTGLAGEFPFIGGSIRLEVEAYLVQALVMNGLGLQPHPWMVELVFHHTDN